MEREFIQYAEALSLKELGFDEPCLGNYRLPTNRLITEWEIRNTPEHALGISTPLYQQAFRWFREKYGLHHNIVYLKFKKQYLTETEGTAIYFDETEYEEAELACLKKLIEIVKEKSL
jgi:hypothetical protein